MMAVLAAAHAENETVMFEMRPASRFIGRKMTGVVA